MWLGLMVMVVECPFFPETPGVRAVTSRTSVIRLRPSGHILTLGFLDLWGGYSRQDPPHTHTHPHTLIYSSSLVIPLVLLVDGHRLSTFQDYKEQNFLGDGIARVSTSSL